MLKRYLGMMSGSSMDGIDLALIECDAPQSPHYLAHAHFPMPHDLYTSFNDLIESGKDEIHRAQCCATRYAETCAAAVHDFLQQEQLRPQDIAALGNHGQTLRHCPHAVPAYSYQLDAPALLAELCGIDVICDFRSRDVAAGGEGAPLAPFFHHAFYAPDCFAVINLGGIANISVIHDAKHLRGFDSGPANVLLDLWSREQRALPYDDAGRWAASGSVLPEVLKALLAAPYFQRPAPKSCGREEFNLAWLHTHLRGTEQAADVAATLTELSAQSLAQALRPYLPAQETTVLLCGGGVNNNFLLSRLHALLPECRFTFSARGIPPQAVEAAGFAWLAAMHCARQTLPLPSVTGARHAAVLGACYPA